MKLKMKAIAAFALAVSCLGFTLPSSAYTSNQGMAEDPAVEQVFQMEGVMRVAPSVAVSPSRAQGDENDRCPAAREYRRYICNAEWPISQNWKCNNAKRAEKTHCGNIVN